MRVVHELSNRLEAAFPASRVAIEDQSAAHAGHAGARPGGESHFHVTVVTVAFVGRSRLERQRMVLQAVGDLMEGRIHALSITALTPGEA
ncbi:MAG TPA: BolA family protein [Geminicoccaceae bacterium]|nr:BolA family protein [Geminicoccaceae bacterium]